MNLPTDGKTLVMISVVYLDGQGTVRDPEHYFSGLIERGGLILGNCVQMSFGTEIVVAKLALRSDFTSSNALSCNENEFIFHVNSTRKYFIEYIPTGYSRKLEINEFKIKVSKTAHY